MRIVQVFRRYGRGGTERVIATLAGCWAADGHEVATWLPEGGDPPEAIGPIVGATFPDGWRADAVVVHGGLLGAGDYDLTAEAIAAPVVEVLHRRRPAKPGATRHVAVSEAVRDVNRHLDTVLIPNGVGLPRPGRTRAEVRAGLGVDPDHPVVIRHGRLAMEKGWHATMRVMDVAWSRGLEATLVVCGDGHPVARIVESWGRGKPSRLVGWTESPEDWLAAADIFLETSPDEAFGLSAAEAGAGGLPVVAFASPGVAEVLGDAAILVAPGDVDAAARALIDLARSPRLRGELGRALARRIGERFDPAESARRYLVLLGALLRESHPAGDVASW